ncbi:MAG: DNA-binding protein WhiA [Actinobacteria bacterium]|nr:DNA-binding protein WhiA [Actinomycetota bacterium]
MSLTTAVRSELAAVALPDGVAGRAELSGMLRFSGVLRRGGGAAQPWTWVSTLRSTVARRADRQLVRLFDVRCVLRARQLHAPRPMLLVEIELPEHLLEPLALDVMGAGVDASRRQESRMVDADDPGLPEWLDADDTKWAYVRGVALAGLRLSRADRPHCEIEVPSKTLATQLAALLADLGVRAVPAGHSRDRWRVLARSRSAIGTLLAGTGATSSYLQWEDERTRRAVRGAATRGANADRANARRSVRAATAQVETVVDALARLDSDRLDDELRTTALARLANPTASLGELAQVLDVSRATVSRRFQRLAAAVADVGTSGDGAV